MHSHRKYVLGVALAGVLAVGGCAAIQGAWHREQAGLNAPMNAAGETPSQVAHRQLEPVKALPSYGNLIYALGSTLLMLGYGWVNGGHNRSTASATATPFTGSLGKAVPMIEHIVQAASTLSQGVLNPPVALKLSPALDRFWKVGAALLTVGVPAVIGSPIFAHFLAAHPQIAAGIGLGVPALLALEKKLQEVQPPPPAPPTA